MTVANVHYVEIMYEAKASATLTEDYELVFRINTYMNQIHSYLQHE